MSEGSGLTHGDVERIVQARIQPVLEYMREVEQEMQRTSNAIIEVGKVLSQGQDQLLKLQATLGEMTVEQVKMANVQLGLIQAENVAGFLKLNSGIGTVTERLDVVDGSVKQMSRAAGQMEVIRVLNEAQDPIKRARTFAEEIRQRFDKALEGCDNVRVEYGQLQHKVAEEYDRKLRVIGSHIFAIYEGDFRPRLDTPLSEPFDHHLSAVIEVDEARLLARSEALDTAASQLGQGLLEPIIGARERIQKIIEEQFQVLAQPSSREVGLPVALVVRANQSVQPVFGLKAGQIRESEPAPETPSPQELAPLATAKALNGVRLRPMSREEKAELVQGLEALVRSGHLEEALMPGYREILASHSLNTLDGGQK